jgi:membrane fusion protein, copper/silver efflux system
MKKIIVGTTIVAILATTFFAGYWYSKGPSSETEAGDRTILYYVDPMNPGNRYDKPGIAPCGMALEPFYGDGDGSGRSASMPPGTVMITPEKQQLIGVRIEQVAKSPSSHTIRLLGRVAADETRVYQVTSSVAGWIRRVQPFSTGSLVKKSEVLASFYATEFLAAEQSYIYALNSANLRANIRTTGIQASIAEQSLQQTEDNLRFLGMGENQIRALGRTREFIDSIDIESPATGLVLTRNISPGLRFDAGAEFYRIADLGEVWILLDTYGNEAKYFRPGETVPVRYQGETFDARVDEVLPQFDASTRTLKVRLVAVNPEYILRPDMFVDVEYPVVMPAALTVPVDAVLDSGMKKTVFVDRGNGFFEPRQVETGRYFGNRVEISKGLVEGERIVVSGNFLIDSESRFKSPPVEVMSPAAEVEPASTEVKPLPVEVEAPATETKLPLIEATEVMPPVAETKPPPTEVKPSMAGMKPPPTDAAKPTSVDPICGMLVDEEGAAESGLTSVHQGKTHYFCSHVCKEQFDRSPETYTGAAGPGVPEGGGPPTGPMSGTMSMPATPHAGGQMNMPEQIDAGDKNRETAMPDAGPAGDQAQMPTGMPDHSMEKPGEMPAAGPAEKGDDQTKKEGEVETEIMQDSPAMEGKSAND